MKPIKRMLALLLACLCVLSLFACGDTDEGTESQSATENEDVKDDEILVDPRDYENAIRDLRALLDKTYSAEDLSNPELYFDWYQYSETKTYPLIHYQEELADLYQRFVSFGDYMQAREIVARFSVLERGKVVVNLTAKNQSNNTEQTTSNVDNFILDRQGRKIWEGYDCHYIGGAFYLYGEDGRLLRESNTFYEYDEKGVLVSSRTKDRDLSNYIFSTYFYDDRGNCIKETHGYKTGVFITYTHTYDDQGRLAGTLDLYERHSDRVSSKREITYNYRYNANGQLTVVQRHSKSDGGIYGSSQDFIEINSEAGNLLYQENQFCGETNCPVDHLAECRYENGLPMSVSFTDGRTYTFDYSAAYLFDEQGLNLSEN